MRKVIVEVRVNEGVGRDANPNVPWTPAEIAADGRACAEEGAAIIHFHARGADGASIDDYETHRDTVAGLRDACDALVHPTVGLPALRPTAVRRLENFLKLAAEGLAPDLVPVSMAPDNLALPAMKRAAAENVVAINEPSLVREVIATLYEHGMTPYIDAWNTAAMRRAAMFLNEKIFRSPPLLMVSLLNEQFIAAHKITFAQPATAEGLKEFIDILPTDAAVHWCALHSKGNILPQIPQIVAMGGHISVGLGDYAYPELGAPTNAMVVREVARAIRKCGAELASPEETRAMLGIQQTRPANSVRMARTA